ncbi:LptF/LptG family permease [Arenibaculum pallidiluteum]|uniref:LptF/LptG family permease n=1 Tax=Arenibaculum pallidiluteum TaxID=2812559 RepID=UPI001A96F617|nr:LptF/LptG family permease [Arenibaculum pallidiluteum]
MRLIDRYILLQTAKPLGISLILVLAALILERILRLFDLLAQQGKEFGQIFNMAANLVPHYLGLALPAAFFISIFLVAARFSEDNELDVLRGCGLSIRRFSRPLLGLAVLLALFSITLYGYVQPYSRYAYRAILYAATSAAWDASVTTGTFIEAGDGYTVHADRWDSTGTWLEHVFVHQTEPGGTEVTTTARRGVLQRSPDGQHIALTLQDAVQIRTPPGGSGAVLAFENLQVGRPFSQNIPSFRDRGDNERELTMDELRSEWRNPASPVPHSRLRSEFDARLVRAASILFLPMLAVPMGMAAKRNFRWQGIAVAAVILLLYHHTIQFGESLADLGRVNPLLGLWLPFAIFASGCLGLHFTAERRPGTDPFGAAFAAVDAAARWIGQVVPRWRPRP